jgi:hypothetical protein
MMEIRKILGTAALATLAMSGVHAGEIYGGIGLPGLMLGYAQPLNERFTLRADVATLGSRTLNRTEEGVDYSVKLKAQRIGAFADWFVLGGGFRVSGGVTSNDYKLSMSAKSTTNISIGSNTYSGTSLEVTVKVPSATPYLGIGYGHHGGKGLSFVWDLGASIGKAKVTANAVGFPDNAQFNADLDRELEQLRSGVGKIRILPQASIAVSYKF